MSSPRPLVLVVDDDPSIRQSLQRALGYEGYDVQVVDDGRDALRWLAATSPAAVVLDLNLPHVDGIGVCRTIRESGDTMPVLMLTARDEIDDRVTGLDAGADDYLVKPFALEELCARLRALLRRPAAAPVGERLTFADLSVDRATRQAERGESGPISLTRMEFELLDLLMRNPRRVLPRSLIYETVWGYDFGPDSNSLEVHIGYLRRKTEPGRRARLIQTVRGVGYVLREVAA